MITIQTSNSKIKNSDGSLASGHLIVEPNDQFQFTDTDSKVYKVSNDPIQVTFTSGVLDASFQLAPTKNASQDKSNLYYTATFFTSDGARKIEYWTIDASGSLTLEITDVTQVIPSPTAKTEDFVSSDLVSVTAIPNGIPQAGPTGTLSAEWITGVSGAVFVYRYIVADREALIGINPGNTIARAYVLNEDQNFTWVYNPISSSGGWRTSS